MIVVGVGALMFTIGWAGTAAADPVNAKKGELLTVTCDNGLGTFDVVTNGNGRFTPGLVTTSNLVGIPYEVHFTGTFTPPGGEPQSSSEDFVKKAPKSGRLANCTFHQEGTDPGGGTFVFDGSVKISYTGAH
jgi:hypothetical protein